MGVGVVGGDVTASAQLMIAVTALGSLEDRAPVTRAGARPGDVLALRGRVGWAAAGLAVLQRGFRSPAVVVDAHRVPEPPYAAGPEAARAGATAMIDVSDGLLADLAHIARASDVVIDVHSATLDVPDRLNDVAAALGADPRDWLLTGGDDHALAATFPDAALLPSGWVRIGTVQQRGAALPVGDDEPAPVLVDGRPYGSGRRMGPLRPLTADHAGRLRYRSRSNATSAPW